MEIYVKPCKCEYYFIITFSACKLAFVYTQCFYMLRTVLLSLVNVYTLFFLFVNNSDEYEYDLVLNTDLYTEKHTQWLVNGTDVEFIFY